VGACETNGPNQGYFNVQSASEDNPTTLVGYSSLFFRRKFSRVKMGLLASTSLFSASEENPTKVVGCLVKFPGNCRIFMVPYIRTCISYNVCRMKIPVYL
jgi:hypothetical protein